MNAFARISHKTQLYKKVGKKYIEHNDPYSLDGLQDGWWLVKVAPNSKTIRSIVYPYNAEIIAAAKDKEDELVAIIREASEAKPKEAIPMSKQCRKDWQVLIEKHGKELSTIYYPSFQENAEKIVKALIGEKK